MTLAMYLAEQHFMAVDMEAEGLRVGRPEVWLPVQAATFTLLLDLGLKSSHQVLDVGSGLLRVGRPVLELVGPERYCSIEPDRALTEAALERLPGPLRSFEKSASASFQFSLFERTFDFVIARSIWSHAARWHILTMLDEFVAVSKPGSVFVASFYDARWWNPRRWPYYGRRWHYKGKTIRPGTRHSKAWIRREAEARGLHVEFRSWLGLGQPWAVLTRLRHGREP